MTTDAEGRTEWSGLQPAKYEVRVEGIAGDPRRELSDARFEIDAPADDVELVLPMHSTIVVDVRDPDGPIGAALVRIAAETHRSGNTDSGGRIAFDAVPGTTYRVHVSQDGFADADLECVGPARCDERVETVALTPCRRPSLAVTVDRDLDAIDFRLLDAASGTLRWQSDVTAEHGIFFLSDLPPGRYRLVARTAGRQEDGLLGTVGDLELPPDGETHGARLEGPCVGWLCVVGRDRDPSAPPNVIVRDDHGREVADWERGVAAGRYTISRSVPGRDSRPADASVTAGETTTVNLDEFPRR